MNKIMIIVVLMTSWRSEASTAPGKYTVGITVPDRCICKYRVYYESELTICEEPWVLLYTTFQSEFSQEIVRETKNCINGCKKKAAEDSSWEFFSEAYISPMHTNDILAPDDKWENCDFHGIW